MPPSLKSASGTLRAEKSACQDLHRFPQTGWISRTYLETATPAELVRDFLAGMTDRYFAKRYEECVIPRRVEDDSA